MTNTKFRGFQYILYMAETCYAHLYTREKIIVNRDFICKKVCINMYVIITNL